MRFIRILLPGLARFTPLGGSRAIFDSQPDELAQSLLESTHFENPALECIHQNLDRALVGGQVPDRRLAVVLGNLTLEELLGSLLVHIRRLTTMPERRLASSPMIAIAVWRGTLN